MNYSELYWESDFFGRNISELRLQEDDEPSLDQILAFAKRCETLFIFSPKRLLELDKRKIFNEEKLTYKCAVDSSLKPLSKVVQTFEPAFGFFRR